MKNKIGDKTNAESPTKNDFKKYIIIKKRDNIDEKKKNHSNYQMKKMSMKTLWAKRRNRRRKTEKRELKNKSREQRKKKKKDRTVRAPPYLQQRWKFWTGVLFPPNCGKSRR